MILSWFRYDFVQHRLLLVSLMISHLRLWPVGHYVANLTFRLELHVLREVLIVHGSGAGQATLLGAIRTQLSQKCGLLSGSLPLRPKLSQSREPRQSLH